MAHVVVALESNHSVPYEEIRHKEHTHYWISYQTILLDEFTAFPAPIEYIKESGQYYRWNDHAPEYGCVLSQSESLMIVVEVGILLDVVGFIVAKLSA